MGQYGPLASQYKPPNGSMWFFNNRAGVPNLKWVNITFMAHYVQVIRVLYRVNGIAYVWSVVSSNRSIGVSGGPQYGPTVGQNGYLVGQ